MGVNKSKQKASTRIAFDNIILDELYSNNSKLDFAETIAGLGGAGLHLSVLAQEYQDADAKNCVIESMEAVISALSYVALMHNIVKTVKSLKGDALC